MRSENPPTHQWPRLKRPLPPRGPFSISCFQWLWGSHMAYFIIPKPGTSSWANTAVLRHVRNMIDSALSRLVYACSKSLSTAGPMSVCSHQCAQVRPGAKMLSANIFMLHSLISASRDVQMLCDMIQTSPWALLFIEKDSLDSKRWTASLKGFTRTSVWDFFSLPKTRLTQTLGFLPSITKK